jgi:DNA replication protein DnaC
MKMLTQPRLLIVDEVGYLGLDQAGAAMLFQVVCNRKKRAAIITSNAICRMCRECLQMDQRERLC